MLQREEVILWGNSGSASSEDGCNDAGMAPSSVFVTDTTDHVEEGSLTAAVETAQEVTGTFDKVALEHILINEHAPSRQSRLDSLYAMLQEEALRTAEPLSLLRIQNMSDRNVPWRRGCSKF